MTNYFFLDEPFRISEEAFIPTVYSFEKSDSPSSFNSVAIPLNARVTSSLNWETESALAKKYIEKGLKIFWKMDLGHFSILDQTQFLALSLGLQHFRDTLWKEFHSETVGISIYEGPVNFLSLLKWDEELKLLFQEWLKDHFSGILFKTQEFVLPLFARDVVLEYLELLARQLPGEAVVYALFDTKDVSDPLLLAQLLSKDCFELLHRGITDGALSPLTMKIQNFGFLGEEMPQEQDIRAKVGVCIPSYAIDIEPLRAVFKKPCRILSEATLTTEWEGLEEIYVVSRDISSQGVRKLRGFCAAGGKVMILGNSLGLANEELI